jgi:hypothetical protein
VNALMGEKGRSVHASPRDSAQASSAARSKIDRKPEKYGHVKREPGSGKRKARGGACLSVFRYAASS